MTSRQRAAGSRRRRGERSYKKLAVSVPSELVQAVEDVVRAHEAPSISAFISDAVEEKLERDRLQDVLDEVWRKEPMTKAERTWADKILKG